MDTPERQLDPPDPCYKCVICERTSENGTACIACLEWVCGECSKFVDDDVVCITCYEEER